MLAPAPADWARRHQRLALERPLEASVHATPARRWWVRWRSSDSSASIWSCSARSGRLVTRRLVTAAGARRWAHCCVRPSSSHLACWFGRARDRRSQAGAGQARRDACLVELRLAVIAPDFADEPRSTKSSSTWRPPIAHFRSGAGNSLRRAGPRRRADLRVLAPLGSASLLNVRELAGLWHLPQADDDVRIRRAHHCAPTAAAASTPLRRTPPGQLPHRRLRASGPRRSRPPADGLLRRHLLAVAKTRRGKSSLLLRMVHHLMHAGGDRPRRAGAGRSASRPGGLRARPRAARPPGRRRLPGRLQSTAAVRHQSAGHRPGLGPRPGYRQRPAHLPPRVRWLLGTAHGGRLPLRRPGAVRSQPGAVRRGPAPRPRRPAHHPGRAGRARAARLPPPGAEEDQRSGHPPVVRRLFRARSNARYRLEIINPVQTKVHKYLGSRVARQIVGQPRSTIDFRQLVAERQDRASST